MAQTLDDLVPGEWERCPDCGFYDPDQLIDATKLMDLIRTDGVESLLNATSLNPESLRKMKNIMEAFKEINEKQYCSCAFPHAINRYRLFDQAGKYIRVTSTTKG